MANLRLLRGHQASKFNVSQYGRLYNQAKKKTRGIFGIGISRDGIFNKQGLSAIKKAMNAIGGVMVESAGDAMLEMGMIILDEATAEAPEDTGSLKKSGFIVYEESAGRVESFTNLGGFGSRDVGFTGDDYRWSEKQQKKVKRIIREHAVAESRRNLRAIKGGFAMVIGFAAEHALYAHDFHKFYFLENAVNNNIGPMRAKLMQVKNDKRVADKARKAAYQ